MTDPLRIAVADDEASVRDYFEDILTRLGHRVVLTAASGAALIEGCREARVDLIITDIKMGDVDGIQAAERLAEGGPARPVILVSAYHDPALIERAQTDHIMAYLVKPVNLASLETAIALAMCRFRQLQVLETEAEDLRQALEDRKLVEKAKGLLMRQANLDEGAAFRRMQKLASGRNLKLVEIARSILTAHEALREDGPA